MTPEDFIPAYAMALQSQDWDKVEPLISREACVTFSTGAVHKGIAAIKAAYQRNFSLIKNEQYEISDVHWVHKGSDLAVYLFQFTWKGIINGRAACGAGRGTTTLVCEQGSWKLLAEHLGPGGG